MALMDPKGAVGSEIKSLIITAFWLMMIVVVPVIVMTFLFAWRYRNTNYKAKYTPNWAHSNVIEAIVWFIPLVIIAFLGVITWQTSHSLNPSKPLESDVEPIEINVVALDWKWLFIYPEQGIASVSEVAFPVDTPVHFNVTSNSVMNSFMIPRLGSQIYAMAGMDNDLNLIAEEEGVYPGRSTNYSGAGYSDMTFEAHATSQQGFDEWVEKVRQSDNSLVYTESFQQLAEPSAGHPVEYYSEVSPELYQTILKSFHGSNGHSGNGHGEEQERGHGNGHDMAMSAEAAE